MSYRPPAPSPSPAAAAAPQQQVYDSSTSLESLQTIIAPLRYADKVRVARDVHGLIQNSNSLAFKIGNFGEAASRH